MPRSVRTISVNLNAGTAKFMGDLDRASNRLKEFGQRGVASAQGTSEALRTLEQRMSDVHRAANALGAAIESGLRATGKIAGASLELVGVARVAQMVLRGQAAEVSLVQRSVEGLRNAIRATEVGFAGLRGGFGAALNIAAPIAAISILEKIVEDTYQRGKQLELQSVHAAKSGLPYESVAELGFAADRAGVAPDFFDSAAKAAGGVDQLALKFKELGEIKDPLRQAQEAFKLFGADAEKYLPFLNERLGENIQRVREWGIALEQIDRERITTFKRDIDSLKYSFVGLGDTIHAWSAGVGTDFSRAFASVYSTVREVPALVSTTMALVMGAIDRLNKAPQIAFTQQPFDAAAAAAKVREQMGIGAGVTGGAAMVDALKSLQPAASKIFLGNRGDQEEALKARVAELGKDLFVGDVTSPRFGQLQPAASFPGGYTGQALAMQEYISAQQRIDAIDKAKEKPEIEVSPFEDRVKRLNAEVAGLEVKLKAVGQTEGVQIFAKAFAEAQTTIEEVNKALEHHKAVKHEALTAEQQKEVAAGQVIGDTRAESAQRTARINLAEQTKASTEAEIAWQTKVAASTVQTEARIKSQEALTAAIGKGYEAVRKASVEGRLIQEEGPHIGDAKWMADATHAANIEALRAEYTREYDAQYLEQAARAVDQLRDQIELERELTRVQSEGVEAGREATLEVKLRQMAAAGATSEQLRAERALFEAQRANANAADVAKINERAEATRRLTAAILGGANAERQAALENRIAEIRRAGDIPVPGMAGMGQKEIAERGADQAAHQEQVTREALRTGLEYRNQLESINEQIALLERIKATQGDNLAIEISLRDLENQRLKVLVDQSLQLRTARDGIRAFFIEMQEQAESSARIIYDTLNSALDRVSSNLAKLFTGQKTDWAKSFQQLGEQMMQSSIKSLAQQGLGKLGKVFGIDLGGQKPDGTSANPIWVRLAGASGVPAIPGGGIPGVPGGRPGGGGVFGGGDQGGGVFSALGKMMGIGAPAWNPAAAGLDMDVATAGEADLSWLDMGSFGGFMADGGTVEPGKVYGIGEEGMEYFAPTTTGRIIPQGELGGGITIHNHVDARGAALGVENRIARGMEATHRASVSTAVRAMHERSIRTPGK